MRLRLNADTHAEKRNELAGLLGDGADCGAVIDTDDAARFSFKPDDIACAETERIIQGVMWW